MNLGAALLPGCQAILCLTSIVLQLVSLPPSYWGTFEAQTEQGTVLERGHFGLWQVCSRRVPFFFEDCESPITYLMLTSLSTAAAALAIIHLLVLVAALPLIVVRLVQSLLRGGQDGHRRLGLATTTVVVVALVLAVIVVILGSMGTDQPSNYQVQRAWAFWIQVAILVVDMCLVLAVALGNVQQLWMGRNTAQEEAASSYHDDFSETYSNPGFAQRPAVYDAQQRAYDPQLPPPMDDDDNGLPPPPPPPPDDEGFPEPMPSVTGLGDDLTYQNPTFADSSPSANRMTAGNEPRYENQ